MKKSSLAEVRKINESLELLNQELMGMNMPYDPEDEDDDDYDADDADDLDGDDFDLGDDDLDTDDFGDEPESDEEGDDDLGSENDVDAAMAIALGDDEESDGDVIDTALLSLIDEVAQEYEEESAISAVYDAVQDLTDENSIEVMPSENDPDELKVDWVNNSIPKIRAKLQSYGIELEGGAETTGGSVY